MKYFPLFVELRGRKSLVIGGGEAAARKLRLLLRAGAAPTVIASEVCGEIRQWQQAGIVRVKPPAEIIGEPGSSELSQYALIIVTDMAEAVAQAISEAARRANVPVNVVDRPKLSNVILPGIVDRDPILVAIGSGGAAPVMVRRLRERIEALLPSRLGGLVQFAQRFRSTVALLYPAGSRRRFWEEFFDGPIARLVLSGKESKATDAMLRLINSKAMVSARGSVALVGAGPGDPDLLTVRALRALQDADVIVYDRLVGDGILDLARRDAERIYVGKAPDNHTLHQDDINTLLASRAQSGQRVLRLKAGDPFLFGRGGEELAFLRDAGLEVDVIPGITAAVGCAAAAGIPLTHRDMAPGVTFLSGHGRADADEPDWRTLAASRNTLVIYMGVAAAGRIADRLVSHGMRAATQVAVIENGTRADQRVIRSDLANLANAFIEHDVSGPAIIIIGDVAIFAEPNALPAAGGGPAVASAS
jgi:uroporphyrin-III C-methyltransferase/precorrin-2 dehydrogenase/sirohydrochlorin ferrochelatase